MGINLRIRKLQKDLIDALNESNLPYEIMLLIIEKLYLEIKQKADAEIEAMKEVANDKRNDTDDHTQNKES